MGHYHYLPCSIREIKEVLLSGDAALRQGLGLGENRMLVVSASRPQPGLVHSWPPRRSCSRLGISRSVHCLLLLNTAKQESSAR